MTIERLRQALSTQPFQPFAVIMADGTRHPVKSPEMIAISPKAERTFALEYGEERLAIIDQFRVSTLEFDLRQRTNGRHLRAAGCR
jgi:hypothetical protein